MIFSKVIYVVLKCSTSGLDVDDLLRSIDIAKISALILSKERLSILNLSKLMIVLNR